MLVRLKYRAHRDGLEVPKQVAEDAQELYEVYWNTFSGLIQSNVCASCGKPLGLDRINDGVSLWNPDCPVPVVH